MNTKALLPAALIAAAGSAAQGQVIITEILANEVGGDVPGEWAEIYNAGNDPVDISGWRFADEDGNSPSDPFPDGFVIQPGEAVVVIGSGVSGSPTAPVIDEDDFFAAWGSTNADGNTYRVIVQDDAITLANTASATNEILTLVDASGLPVDEANYQNGTDGWPGTPNGASVVLGANFLDPFANDFGCAWSVAIAGVDGAVTSNEVFALNDNGDSVVAFGQDGIASPGYVAADSVMVDCNNNGLDDSLDICNGTSADCNGNGIPDECEDDCNGNGIVDSCDIEMDYSIDCDLDRVIDSCEIASNPSLDMNGNGRLDLCEQYENQVIITEILFDPYTSAEEMEYVEILNVSGGPLDISGWYLQDIEFNGDGPTDAIPAGTTLSAGGVAVLTRSVTGDVNETRDDYIEAWGATTPDGTPINWIPLENWGARATFGTDVAEVLSVVSAAGTVVDTVNYSNRTSNSEPLPGGWPGADGHGSYFLSGQALDAAANDIGTNWRLSIEGLSGAIRSNAFDLNNPPSWTNPERSGEDYGSPGYIHPGAPEEPSGTVIITEIMATTGAVFPGQDPMDPLSDDGIDEWVEIYNTTNAPIDISGWYLQDEDGRTSGLPNGSVLEAGEVAVIYGNDFTSENPSPISAFYDAWGCDYQVFVVSEWYTNNAEMGLGRLSDSPNFVNEILRLVDASGKPTDMVNYDDDAFVWPVDGTGVSTDDNWSIYIISQSDYNSVNNDDGVVWADSLEPIDGARTATSNNIFNSLGSAFGSPGTLPGVQTPNLEDCPADVCLADVNGDGVVDPSDFSAWINAFNNNLPECDQNGDSDCTPADFSAWINNYNTGC